MRILWIIIKDKTILLIKLASRGTLIMIKTNLCLAVKIQQQNNHKTKASMN
jgi:hypothetical protein